MNDFLEQERRHIKETKLYEKQAEVSIYWHPTLTNISESCEHIKRQFLIKTRCVYMNCDTPLFLHIFIETTQINQLEEAKAQNKYQKQMLANVSHEFRTPLNAMLLSLDLLKESVDQKHMKFLKIAISSTSILSSLVEDILDHAKIESGVFETQDVIFKLFDALEEVKSIFELQTQNKHLDFDIKYDDFLSNIYIKSDKQRIKQVLLNLISNALKFTQQGGIYIKFTSEQINGSLLNRKHMVDEDIDEWSEQYKLASEDVKDTDNEFDDLFLNNRIDYFSKLENSFNRDKIQPLQFNRRIVDPHASNINFKKYLKITFVVKDTGCGISKGDHKELFKLFGKLKASNGLNKTGCGLGLTICKQILQKLDGDINILSEESKGTTATCTFVCMY